MPEAFAVTKVVCRPRTPWLFVTELVVSADCLAIPSSRSKTRLALSSRNGVCVPNSRFLKFQASVYLSVSHP